MLTPGELFAEDFEVLRPLSQGGMGAVFLVRQRSTDAIRALKIMLPKWVHSASLRARFEREAKASGRIESEHVVKTIAYGVDQARGVPWLAMEYLPGETLESRLRERGTPSFAVACEMLRQLFHGVAAAHAAGVVHRDLKPSNLYLARAQRADVAFTLKVLDFGIARVSPPEQPEAQAMGTRAWMAPEQDSRGGTVGASADVWALALIAFYLFTGKSFWLNAHSSTARLSHEIHFEPIPAASQRARELGSELPPEFDAWFERCLERDPRRRPENAAACFRELWPLLALAGSRDVSARDACLASTPVPNSECVLGDTARGANALGAECGSRVAPRAGRLRARLPWLLGAALALEALGPPILTRLSPSSGWAASAHERVGAPTVSPAEGASLSPATPETGPTPDPLPDSKRPVRTVCGLVCFESGTVRDHAGQERVFDCSGAALAGRCRATASPLGILCETGSARERVCR